MQERKNASPESISVHNFSGIIRGPEVIFKLRQEVQNGSLDNNPLQAAHDFFRKENYPLSKRQRNLLSQSVNVFEEHRRASLKVRALYASDREALKEKIAQGFDSTKEGITDLTLHDTSVTAALASDVFTQQWEKLCDRLGVDMHDVMRPFGISSPEWTVNIQGDELPVSIEDGAKKKDNKTAIHEDLHVQYRYLHNEGYLEQEKTTKEYQEDLAKRSSECIATNDYSGFRNLIRELTHNQISIYLNELSSAALAETDDVYEQAFEYNHLYNLVFKKGLQAVRNNIPQSFHKGLQWELIIFEELQKGKHQAKFIDNEYQKLLEEFDYPPEKLVAIAEFLTPEQGFLIRSFTDGPPTFPKLKNWKKEYEKEPIDETRKKGVNFWVDFLSYCLDISSAESMKIQEKIEQIVEEKFRESVSQRLARVLGEDNQNQRQGDDPLVKIEGQILLLKELTISRIERIKAAIAETNLDFIPPETDQNTLRAELFKEAVDFDLTYLGVTDEIRGSMMFGSSKEEAERLMIRRKRVIKRSFSLDDAAEELVESLAQDAESNYEAIFAEGFQRNDEKRERMRESLELLGDKNTEGVSPLEDDKIDFFRKMMACLPDKRISLCIDQPLLMIRLFSSCMRILVWAKENHIPDDKLVAIKRFISESYKAHLLPAMYRESIEDGDVDISRA